MLLNNCVCHVLNPIEIYGQDYLDGKWWLQFILIPVAVRLHSRLILEKNFFFHKEAFGI